MRRDIQIGTVSWINRTPNPVYTSAQAALLTPGWIPKTYLGLAATSNDPPRGKDLDFAKYKEKKTFAQ